MRLCAHGDQVLASATIDVGAIMFDGAKHGDGQREIFLVNGAGCGRGCMCICLCVLAHVLTPHDTADADVAATAAATSGTKVNVSLKFRQALAQVLTSCIPPRWLFRRGPRLFVLLRSLFCLSAYRALSVPARQVL